MNGQNNNFNNFGSPSPYQANNLIRPLYIPQANFSQKEAQIPTVKQGSKLLADMANSLNDLLVKDGELDEVIKKSEKLDEEEEKRRKKFIAWLIVSIIMTLAAIVAFVILAIVNHKRNENFRDAKKDLKNGESRKSMENDIEYTYTNKDNVIEKTMIDPADPTKAATKLVETFTDQTLDCTPIIQGFAGSLLGAGTIGIIGSSVYEAKRDDNVLTAIEEERKNQKGSIETNAKIKQNTNLLHSELSNTLGSAIQAKGKQLSEMIGQVIPISVWNEFYNNNFPIAMNNGATEIYQQFDQQYSNYNYQ